jgi:hypothetical protein
MAKYMSATAWKEEEERGQEYSIWGRKEETKE